MEKVAVDELDSWIGPASVKRPVGKALGTEHVALNYYELAPGESFAFGYHAHEKQEEVFYVVEGTATFETDDGPLRVGAGEAVRFEPGEFQRGVNEGTDRVRALAVGAPADPGELTLLRECEPCGRRSEHRIEPRDDRRALVTVCTDCGAETGRSS